VANLIQTAKMTARLAQATNLIQASNLTTRLTQATNLSQAAKLTARLALVENLIQAVKLYARVASLANLTPYARLASPHDSANFWPQGAMATRSTSPLAMGSSLGGRGTEHHWGLRHRAPTYQQSPRVSDLQVQPAPDVPRCYCEKLVSVVLAESRRYGPSSKSSMFSKLSKRPSMLATNKSSWMNLRS
jgi:hypothetical protein